MKLKFPDGFLWGSAVSSYQVDGDINNCDWSTAFPAGRACLYYSRYEKYFDIAKELNQNIHRFSLEWSRIQPQEGKFNRNEIEHCKQVLHALRNRNIKSMVTLWHYTLPIWFSKIGGWENGKSSDYFQEYLKFVVEELKDYVDYWIILNEPEVYISLAYILGICPPKKTSDARSALVFFNLMKAHKSGYDAIHNIIPNAKVSSALNMTFVDQYKHNSTANKLAAFIWDYFRNGIFLNSIKHKIDFLAMNYYFHERIKTDIKKFPFPFKVDNQNKDVSDLGWEIYPSGIYEILMKLARYKLPVFITENGLADKADRKREKFIKDHLLYVHKAIEAGVDVRGYLHWSLLDNFEWTFGFTPRFGLVEMNYNNLETKIRPSAYEYAKICKENALETD